MGINNLTEKWGHTGWKEPTSEIPHTWWWNPRKNTLSFEAGIAGACFILELGFLRFFSFLASSFLSFDLMIWLRYVLIMFLGLNLLKYDYLGSKWRNLRFKQSEKRPKDP